MNNNHTYKEISGQIKSWKENFGEITGRKTKISMAASRCRAFYG